MNETMTLCLEIIFWLALFVVFYTYLGYGIVLYILVKLKELFVKPVKRSLPASDADLPEVTLFITAFNEEDVVDEKMENSLELDYPADKLHIVWVTDGSDDGTNERLQTRWQGKATVHFQPLRQGKTAAMTRGMTLVDTPLVVFTDANTMVNREAIREIVLAFQDPKVGCVAGEKRIAVQTKDGAAAGGDILQQALVLDQGQLRIVDAGEGLEALGEGLAGPGAQNDLAIEHDLHPAAAPAGIQERVGKVALGVGTVVPDGLLGPGEDDGLGAVLDEIAQGRRRIGHGVRPVGEDEAVVVIVVRPDAAGHGQPVLGGDVGAVQVQDLQAVRPAEL